MRGLRIRTLNPFIFQATSINKTEQPSAKLILLFLIWIAVSCLSGEALNRQALTDYLNKKLTSQLISGAKTGVLIMDAQDGSIIYEYNGTQMLIPASLGKLFTAVDAYSELGAEFRFSTQIGCTGEVKNGVLDGDLVVRGSGDPSWIEELYPNGPHQVFGYWADSLRVRGIRDIRGELCADLSELPLRRYNPNWDDEDFPYYYAPSVCALSFNANMVSFVLNGGKNAGSKVSVSPRFGYDYLKCENKLKTCNANQGSEFWLQMEPSWRKVVIEGKVAALATDVQKAAVRNPASFALSQLNKSLNRKDIEFHGECLADSFFLDPATYQPLFSFTSVPLQTILQVMLKKSNNMLAETLYWVIASRYPNKDEHIAEYFRALGIADSLFVLTDGCGLARNNSVSARQIGHLLTFASRQKWFDGFSSALAKPGEEGTLRLFDLDADARKRIFGKTGSMSGIRNMAGYFRNDQGKLYCFVLMLNNLKSSSNGKFWMQDICNKLVYFSDN
jgi:serine-type D-Ala-D-Ala carboxypeptidase/endopeptidase (penicillin-binding protein 4)